MQAIIYYFTGTRNTLMVCQQYKQAFENRGIDCTLFDMSEQNAPNPATFDFVGFAHPIHGFNAPYIVYKFVRSLPKGCGKNYFIVKTSGEPIRLNNASSIHLCDKLKKQGFGVLTNEYHYVMPYNMIFRHTDMQAQKMWNIAQALVPVDVDEIISGKVNVLKRPAFGRLISCVLRIEHSAMKTNGRTFKVTKDCIKCMKCVNNCPVHNITYDEKAEKFHFGGNCIMCARCSFNCPKDAIKIGILNGWRVNGPYKFSGEVDLTQKCKKPNYCKKAYERYFREAEEKLQKYNAQGGANN